MKYISLLRGINVSGRKKIKMMDLKVQYENLLEKKLNVRATTRNWKTIMKLLDLSR